MSSRSEIDAKFAVNNKSLLVKLINNPTIDDVLNIEARVYAASVGQGNLDTDRRVERDLRDFLIRIGVER